MHHHTPLSVSVHQDAQQTRAHRQVLSFRRMRDFAGAILAVVFAIGFFAGCSSFMAVKGQQKRGDSQAAIRGTVSVDGEARGSLVVGLLTRSGDAYRLVDYYLAATPGPWAFAMEPGTYWLAAFEDSNSDGRYEDEPALALDPGKPIVAASGDRIKDVALHIPRDGRFDRSFVLKDLMKREPDEQDHRSLMALCVAGKVTTLEDPRFARETATSGMWKFVDFLYEVQPGIYFLEEYDPGKTPVLFVHGIAGTPIDFADMIGALDRTKYQPWVYYYPSGARLGSVSDVLVQLVSRVRAEYGVKRLAVVAHSMGGLVTRDFLLKDFETNGSTSIPLYVTISSPLGGMPSAGAGVAHSPVVVHSWRALAPGSVFLDGLYFHDVPTNAVRRRLPAHMAYHMLFGYKEGSSDGVVPIASQLRQEAQEEARSLRGFDEDHTGILRSPDAIGHLNRILGSLSTTPTR